MWASRKRSNLVIFAMIISLVLNVTVAGTSKTAAATVPVTTKLLQGFESTSKWYKSRGVTAAAVDQPRTEGTNATTVTFNKGGTHDTWMTYGLGMGTDSIGADISDTKAFTLDVYPTSVTSDVYSSEPIAIKMVGGTGTVFYEAYLPRLNANAWNTVTFTPASIPATLKSVELYVGDMRAQWGTRTSIAYTFDNLRAVLKDSAVPPDSGNYMLKLDGLESAAGWNADPGISVDSVSNTKTEGAYALKVKYTKAQAASQWMNFQTVLATPLDLSTAWGMTLDVYPTTQTQANGEPLAVKISDTNGKTVYENSLPKLTVNQWNHVFIDFRNTGLTGDRSKVYKINFYINRDGDKWEGRPDVTYIMDNLGMRVPSMPVIAADQVSGIVTKGTPITLSTSVAGGAIYYTTNGENPITSTSRMPYTQPIVIDGDKTITAYVTAAGSTDSFLHIFKYTVRSPIELSLTSDKAGNIFTSEENSDIKVHLKDLSGASRNMTISYSVSDYKGQRVYSDKQENVSLGAYAQLDLVKTIPVQRNGVYELTVNASSADQTVNETGMTSFSRVLPLLADRGDGMFGVMTHFAHGKGIPEKTLSIAALGGAQLIRDEMYWNQAERVKGVIQIDPKWDEYVNTAIANGIEPLLILSFGNPLYDQGGIPYTQEGIAAYTNYATTLVNHFKGKINYFEIWNEPNSPAGVYFNPTGKTAVDYANLVKAVYPAIKQANPQAVVLIGSTAGVDLPWLRQMFQAGAYDSMDALALHPYVWPNGPEAGSLTAKLNAAVSLMQEFGNGQAKPIWATEMGWPSHSGASGVSDITNADYLVRAYVLSLSTGAVDKMFWYDLQDDGSNAQDSESRFGLIRYQYDAETPYAAKPNYVAYNTLAHELIGAAFVDKSNPDASLNLYKFHRASDNKDVLVAWNTFTSKTVGLQVGDGTFKVTDLFGNSEWFTAVNGVITVTISDMPLYIEGSIGSYNAASPNFFTDQAAVNVLAGDSFRLSINRASAAGSLSGKVKAKLPDGWTLTSESSFGAGTDPIVLNVSVPAGAVKKPYDTEIMLLSEDEQAVYADLAVKANVTDPVQVKIIPSANVPVTDGEWSLQVTLSNISTNPISGTISLAEPHTGWASGVAPVSFDAIAPGSHKVIRMPIGKPDQKAYDVKLGIQLTNGYTSEYTRTTSFLAAAALQGNSIVPDGQMTAEEWNGSSEFDLDGASQYVPLQDSQWRGADNLSGKGYLKWDSDNLYLALQVKDDVHYQTSTGIDIWKADSVQFAIDPYRINGPSQSGNNHEIGIALGANGIEKYRWTATAGKQSGAFPNMAVGITRNENAKITAYEAAIPWSELLPDGVAPADGDLYGFSLLINDNDGNGRRGFVEYRSGIGNSKNPGLYGDLVLAAPLDLTPPVTTDNASVGWINQDVAVSLTANDTGSGVAATYFTVDGGAQQQGNTVAITEEGRHTISYWSVDKAGNVEPSHTATVMIDKTAPESSAVASSAKPVGSNGWYTSDVTVSLSVYDNLSGVAKTEYQVNDGAWIVYTGSIPAFGEGVYTVGYRSTDQAGNVEPIKTIAFKIDKTPPVLTVQLDKTSIWPDNHKMVTIQATLNSSDATSGVAAVVLTSITSNEPDSGQGDIQAIIGTPATSFSLRAERSGQGIGRVYTIIYTATDIAGNKSATSTTVIVPHDQSGD